MEVKSEHQANEFAPIETTKFGIVMAVKWQLQNV